jgi:hypothetical protein
MELQIQNHQTSLAIVGSPESPTASTPLYILDWERRMRRSNCSGGCTSPYHFPLRNMGRNRICSRKAQASVDSQIEAILWFIRTVGWMKLCLQLSPDHEDLKNTQCITVSTTASPARKVSHGGESYFTAALDASSGYSLQGVS